MDILIVWLIITPLFFAFGWFAGRVDIKVLIKNAKQVPQRLFDGIDSLVENKTGLARDEIQQVVDQEPQHIDLQLSLGKLYRKRGENDLAIKLHTKLLKSQFVLTNDLRDKIQVELAQDFQKAGLIDRAENILVGLIDSQYYSHQALELLLLIYQQDKNWAEAINTANKLARSDISFNAEIAQFNCELAQEAIIRSNYDDALQYINQALQINRNCVRANMLLGELHFNQEQYREAIEAWQLIEKQNFKYIPFIIQHMFEAYQRLDKIKEFLVLLKGYAKLYPQNNMYEFTFKTLTYYDTHEEAIEYLHAVMSQKPSAKVASLIIDARSSELNTASGKNDAITIRDLLIKYDEKNSHHDCGRCNFKSKTFFWQCPACYEWESISPNNN